MDDKKPEEKSRMTRKKKITISTLIVVLILGALFSYHGARLWVCSVTTNLFSVNTFCVAVNVLPIRYDPKTYYDAIEEK